MKIGLIGEGDTEFNAVPTMIAKLGHVVVGNHNLCGAGADYPWEALFVKKVYPYARAFAIKAAVNRPDKVIVILDREERPECCGSLATLGVTILKRELATEQLELDISVILANRQFECWLMANTSALDGSPLMRRNISTLLGETVDETNVMGIIKDNLKKGIGWDKPRYGKALAQKLNLHDATVLARSRSLRKFVKELTPLTLEYTS